MLLYSALLLIGFLMLFKSADQFVIGSVTTAKNFHISPMLIGLTVVALGTSAPEIFVAAAASLRALGPHEPTGPRAPIRLHELPGPPGFTPKLPPWSPWLPNSQVPRHQA